MAVKSGQSGFLYCTGVHEAWLAGQGWATGIDIACLFVQLAILRLTLHATQCHHSTVTKGECSKMTGVLGPPLHARYTAGGKAGQGKAEQGIAWHSRVS